MELREPPRPPIVQRPDNVVRSMLAAILLVLLGLVAWTVLRPSSAPDSAPERSRELATRLKAAGAIDEAAEHFERYLEDADLAPAERARVAYSLGSTLLEEGDYEGALRWFYEADLTGSGELSEELGRKIVHTLERLGRFHAAQSALESRVRLEDASLDPIQRPVGDPVVARIGDETIHRSDVERALDRLPPELARTVRTPADRQEFARQFVAEELLWRKARKLEYDRDEEVLRRHESALKQLAVSRLVEDEVAAKIQVDEADLRNFFAANAARYQRPGGEGGQPQTPTFEQARQVVERDYRMSKMQSGYQELIESELAAAEVQIFAEAMGDGS